MNGFRRADGSEVAVTLIGKDKLVRIGALDTGCNRRRSAVRRFDHVAVEVVVGKHGAAYRADTDGIALDAHFINDLAEQSVDNAVRTAGAVVHGDITECVRSFKYSSHSIL